MEEPREGLRRGVTGLICDERGKEDPSPPRSSFAAFPGINPERSFLSLYITLRNILAKRAMPDGRSDGWTDADHQNECFDG